MMKWQPFFAIFSTLDMTLQCRICNKQHTFGLFYLWRLNFFSSQKIIQLRSACRGKKCLQTSVPAIRLYNEFHSVLFSNDFIHILIFSFRWQFTPTITTQQIDKPDKAVFHNITASSSWQAGPRQAHWCYIFSFYRDGILQFRRTKK